jgi:hypothetical protein
MNTDDLQVLRAALVNVTPGPWITAGPSFGDSLPRYTDSIVRDTDDDECHDVCRFQMWDRGDQHEIDAAYIAAASPDRIARLLDEVEEKAIDLLDAECVIERLRTERDRYRAALELIAAPMREDGTYNRCREACQQIAAEALRDDDAAR